MFPDLEKNRKSTHEQSGSSPVPWQADKSREKPGKSRDAETSPEKRPEEHADEEES